MDADTLRKKPACVLRRDAWLTELRQLEDRESLRPWLHKYGKCNTESVWWAPLAANDALKVVRPLIITVFSCNYLMNVSPSEKPVALTMVATMYTTVFRHFPTYSICSLLRHPFIGDVIPPDVRPVFY